MSGCGGHSLAVHGCEMWHWGLVYMEGVLGRRWETGKKRSTRDSFQQRLLCTCAHPNSPMRAAKDVVVRSMSSTSSSRFRQSSIRIRAAKCGSWFSRRPARAAASEADAAVVSSLACTDLILKKLIQRLFEIMWKLFGVMKIVRQLFDEIMKVVRQLFDEIVKASRELFEIVKVVRVTHVTRGCCVVCLCHAESRKGSVRGESGTGTVQGPQGVGDRSWEVPEIDHQTQRCAARVQNNLLDQWLWDELTLPGSHACYPDRRFTMCQPQVF